MAMTEPSNVPPQDKVSRRWSARRWLLAAAGFLTLVGAMFLATGVSMPAYKDPVAAERVRSGNECEPGVPNKNENLRCDSRLWYRSMDSLRTNKWNFVDVGAGLLASALSILVFALWNGARNWREMRTPRRIWWIFALASVAWLMQMPAYEILFLTELTRGYYPHWADSIAIPIMQTQVVVVTFFLPYVLLWLVFVVGARLPVPLFYVLPGRPSLNIIWAFAAALLFVPVVASVVGGILEGPTLMLPFLWLTLYLTLSARAAALSRHAPKAKPAST